MRVNRGATVPASFPSSHCALTKITDTGDVMASVLLDDHMIDSHEIASGFLILADGLESEHMPTFR
jgi:hypothetical protein